MKTALTQLLSDLLSALIYLAVFAISGRIEVAAAVAIVVALSQLACGVLRGRPVSAMQWMGLAVALLLSGLTLITHDSRFIQWKPSIAHFAIGAVMLKRGWQLPYLPSIAKQLLPERLLVGWGYAWAGLMFASGLANVAAAECLSLAAWAAFVTSLLVVKLAFFVIQYLTMRAAGRRLHARRPIAAPRPERAPTML